MKTFTKHKSVIIVTGLLFIHSLFAQKPSGIQYISPVDGSELNARTSQIIIKPREFIDPSSIDPEIFSVNGEKSGHHHGEVVLSSNGKTIIFKPDSKFDTDELVQVRVKEGLKLQTGQFVPAFKFSFKTTPLENPLDIKDYAKELNLNRLPEEIQQTSIQNQVISDDLPVDFPTYTFEVNDTTSPGDYFFSPTRIISNDGYNVIVSKTGELKYYRKIDAGVPFDFKVAANGQLSFGIMSEMYEFGGGGDTEFQLMDNEYNVVKQIQMGNGYTSDFHEFEYLPNGHVFMVAYDLQPVDMSELVDGGHPGALVAGSVIQEIDLNGNVVFQWRSWDHYDLLDSYADLTQTIFDAIHINSIELDLSDLNIIVSTLALAEATKINRNTGEIIWRMGGKNNEFTFENESQENAPLYFMFQHEIRRLKNGNITMFDGGDAQRRKYSRAVEYQIDENTKTATKVWEYRKDPDIFSPNMGSVQRLANGNTVIGWGLASMTSGQPMITEVDEEGDIVAELTFDKPLTTSYRAMKFNWDGGTPTANVLRFELLTGNTYIFDEEEQKTGVSIKINQHDGFGYNEMRVKRYKYGPLSPMFINRAPVLEQTRIIVEHLFFDVHSYQGEIMFDVDFYEILNPDSVVIYHREFEGQGLFVPIPTQYNKATNKIVATMSKFGEFLIGYPNKINEVFAPVPVRPEDDALVDQSKKITLEWSPVGYTNSFKLEVATDADFNNIIIEEQNLIHAVYDVETVMPNTKYYWRVSAINFEGESEWSQTYSFVTSDPFITILTPQAGKKWRIGLEYYITWEDNLTEEVILELFENDEKMMIIDTVASTGGYKWGVPLHLDVGDHYSIHIRSVDNSDISAESPGDFTLTDEPIAVPEHQTSSQNFHVSFSPYAKNTQIRYQIKKSGHVKIKLYNTQGRIIKTLVDEDQIADTYTLNFATNGLANGVYIGTLVINGNLIASEKVVIVK